MGILPLWGPESSAFAQLHDIDGFSASGYCQRRRGSFCMIVALEDLAVYRGTVAMVDGAFDPLHAGHISYFEGAAKLGVPVLCNLAPDRYVEGKHFPSLPQKDRASLIDALKPIRYVQSHSFDTETVLRELRPKYYVKGKDWEGKLPKDQMRICKE